MKFGLNTLSLFMAGASAELLADVAQCAEELGFDSMWMGHHVMFEKMMASEFRAEVKSRAQSFCWTLVHAGIHCQLGAPHIPATMSISRRQTHEFRTAFRRADLPTRAIVMSVDGVPPLMSAMLSGPERQQRRHCRGKRTSRQITRMLVEFDSPVSPLLRAKDEKLSVGLVQPSPAGQR